MQKSRLQRVAVASVWTRIHGPRIVLSFQEMCHHCCFAFRSFHWATRWMRRKRKISSVSGTIRTHFFTYRPVKEGLTNQSRLSLSLSAWLQVLWRMFTGEWQTEPLHRHPDSHVLLKNVNSRLHRMFASASLATGKAPGLVTDWRKLAMELAVEATESPQRASAVEEFNMWGRACFPIGPAHPTVGGQLGRY